MRSSFSSSKLRVLRVLIAWESLCDLAGQGHYRQVLLVPVLARTHRWSGGWHMQCTRTAHFMWTWSIFFWSVFSYRFLKREELYEPKSSKGLWCQGGDLGDQAWRPLWNVTKRIQRFFFGRESCERPTLLDTQVDCGKRHRGVTHGKTPRESLAWGQPGDAPTVQNPPKKHLQIHSIQTYAVYTYSIHIYIHIPSYPYKSMRSHTETHKHTQTNCRANGFQLGMLWHWQGVYLALGRRASSRMTWIGASGSAAGSQQEHPRFPGHHLLAEVEGKLVEVRSGGRPGPGCAEIFWVQIHFTIWKSKQNRTNCKHVLVAGNWHYQGCSLSGWLDFAFKSFKSSSGRLDWKATIDRGGIDQKDGGIWWRDTGRHQDALRVSALQVPKRQKLNPSVPLNIKSVFFAKEGWTCRPNPGKPNCSVYIGETSRISS